METFYSKLKIKKYVHVGENLFSFETNDEIVDYFSEHGNNDVKYSFAYGKENIYFMAHHKFIPIQENKNSTMKNEYQFLYKKVDENDGIVEYGNDFINCDINYI